MNAKRSPRKQGREAFGPEYHIVWYKVSDLIVDPAYQRTTREKRAFDIAEKFDARLFDPITVSERDDGYYVVDGGHRFLAAMLADIEEVPGIPSRYRSLADEAAGYVAKNKSQRPLLPMEAYEARITARDQIALDVADALGLAGIRIKSQLMCITAVVSVREKWGKEVLDATMIASSVALICGEEKVPLWVVAGCGLLIAKNPHIELDRLRAKLSENYAAVRTDVEAAPKMGSGSRAGISAEAIARRYNSRLSPSRKIIWKDASADD